MKMDHQYVEGLDSFLGSGGDLVKYIYSGYNEITQYINERKKLATLKSRKVT